MLLANFGEDQEEHEDEDRWAGGERRQRLLKHLRARIAMLTALTRYTPTEPARLANALTALISDNNGGGTPGRGAGDEDDDGDDKLPRSRLPEIHSLIEPLIDAARWADAVLRAEPDAVRYLQAAKAKAQFARQSRSNDPLCSPSACRNIWPRSTLSLRQATWRSRPPRWRQFPYRSRSKQLNVSAAEHRSHHMSCGRNTHPQLL